MAVYHNPWYNSNLEKQNEFETLGMQAAFEPLFKAYGVNFVLNGHVHAYERSFPVYQFNPTPDAPAYVVVGTGADSVHDNVWLNETSAPAWSAYRNATQWGTGTLVVASEKQLTWQWHWNLDGILVAADEVTICNTALGYPTYCEGLQFQCTLRLRGASKAAWTAQSAQRLVNLTSAATGVAASQLLVRKPAPPRTKKARMLGELLAAEAAVAVAVADEGKSEGRGTLRMEWTGDKTAAGVRGGGMRVLLEAFGLPGTKKGDADDAAAAQVTAHAIERYLKSPAFVAAFGQGVSAASASCSKPRFGTAKL